MILARTQHRLLPMVATAMASMVAAVIAATPARADQEAANRAYVTTDPWGTCYARSAPADDYGTAGRTDIYAVGTIDQPDMPVASHGFFASQLYLSCRVIGEDGVPAVAMAGLGPWPRGSKPDGDTLAIAFFHGGREVARYSTLDISAGKPDAASCSVSHYQVIGDIEGYQRNDDDREIFVLTTVDGRRLSFDAATGALLETIAGQAPAGGLGGCF
jgi:hypothetical protein